MDHDTALGLYLRRVWMWVVQLRVVALELHTVIDSTQGMILAPNTKPKALCIPFSPMKMKGSQDNTRRGIVYTVQRVTTSMHIKPII